MFRGDLTDLSEELQVVSYPEQTDILEKPDVPGSLMEETDIADMLDEVMNEVGMLDEVDMSEEADLSDDEMDRLHAGLGIHYQRSMTDHQALVLALQMALSDELGMESWIMGQPNFPLYFHWILIGASI